MRRVKPWLLILAFMIAVTTLLPVVTAQDETTEKIEIGWTVVSSTTEKGRLNYIFDGKAGETVVVVVSVVRDSLWVEAALNDPDGVSLAEWSVVVYSANQSEAVVLPKDGEYTVSLDYDGTETSLVPEMMAVTVTHPIAAGDSIEGQYTPVTVGSRVGSGAFTVGMVEARSQSDFTFSVSRGYSLALYDYTYDILWTGYELGTVDGLVQSVVGVPAGKYLVQITPDVPQAGSFIFHFDSTPQAAVDVPAGQSMLNEDFSYANFGGFTNGIPEGWATIKGFFGAGDGLTVRMCASETCLNTGQVGTGEVYIQLFPERFNIESLFDIALRGVTSAHDILAAIIATLPAPGDPSQIVDETINGHEAAHYSFTAADGSENIGYIILDEEPILILAQTLPGELEGLLPNVLQVIESIDYHIYDTPTPTLSPTVTFTPSATPTATATATQVAVTDFTAGDLIAFTAPNEAKNVMDLYAYNVATQEITQLTDDPFFERALVWSPDGEKLAYFAYSYDLGSSIRVISLRDGTNVNITQGLVGNFVDEPKIAWSSDGTRIAFTLSGDIYIAQADGSERYRLTDLQATSPGNRERFPFWTEDGEHILFQGSVGGFCSILSIPVSANRGQGTEVSPLCLSDADIAPDGSALASSVERFKNPGFETRIFLIPITSGQLDSEIVSLSDPMADRSPRWSPDSTQILYIADSGVATEFRLIDVISGDVRTLFSEVHNVSAPSWSPDGQSFVYGRCDADGCKIYQAKTDGSQPESLGINYFGSLGWQPNAALAPVRTPEPTVTPSLTFTPSATIDAAVVVTVYTVSVRVFAEPSLQSDVVAEVSNFNAAVTGITADRQWVQFEYEGQLVWAKFTIPLQVRGDLSQIPVIEPQTPTAVAFDVTPTPTAFEATPTSATIGDALGGKPTATVLPTSTSTPTSAPTSTPPPRPSPTEVILPTEVVPTPVSCPGLLPSRLIVGQRGQVILEGGNTANRIRSEPGTAYNRIGEIPPGGIFDVLEGPECADGYTWWRVNYDGLVGWTAEAGDGRYWIEPVSGVADNVDVVTECFIIADSETNLRRGPGTNYSIGGRLFAGDRQTVIGQAHNASGFVWYKLENNLWVREDVIQLQGDCTSVPVSG